MGRSLKTLRFLFSPKINSFWKEIGKQLADSICPSNYKVQVWENFSAFDDEAYQAVVAQDCINIIVGSADYVGVEGILLSPERCNALLSSCYLLQGEQPGSLWVDRYLDYFKRAKGIFDISSTSVTYYKSLGINAWHWQLGYAENYVGASDAKGTDMLFLGGLTLPRGEFFSKHSDYFSQSNAKLIFSDISVVQGSRESIFLDNSSRNSLCADSRIVFDVNGHGLSYFTWHRALLALSNKCLYISDDCLGFEPLIPGEHFVSVSKDYLFETIRYFNEHRDLAQSIAAKGHEFVTSELRQDKLTNEFLDCFFSSKDSHRAVATLKEGASRRQPAEWEQNLISLLESTPPDSSLIPKVKIAETFTKPPIYNLPDLSAVQEKQRLFEERQEKEVALISSNSNFYSVRDNERYVRYSR